jgi:hypothetical protein
VSPARQSLQAAYISHLRCEVASGERKKSATTAELAVSKSLVGKLSRGFGQSAAGHN